MPETTKRRRRKLGRAAARRFLATEQGQAWLDRQIAAKHAARPDPGLAAERLTRTRFPFDATVNGAPVVVTRAKDGSIEIAGNGAARIRPREPQLPAARRSQTNPVEPMGAAETADRE